MPTPAPAIYNGKEVDQQTHLGFDLAVTAVFRPRRNAGWIVNADWLGITAAA